MEHSNLYVVDNAGDERSVSRYLREWCGISKQMDIATGYLELGGLLQLDGDWQKLDKIRIIMGNEVTRRTRDAMAQAATQFLAGLKCSIDSEHERNEFLLGVPAIIDALKSRKIECRVYSDRKFHAKAYITHFRDDFRSQFIKSMDIGTGYALVGSSNFTHAGLTQNMELNVQLKQDVEELQEWFDRRWDEGQDITEAVLKVVERQARAFNPYDVYLRSMVEYFHGHEGTVSDWENNESSVWKILSQYQKDGYNNLLQIADRYQGAFLCDGVGLGKTYVGMMLIERLVKKERKNVVLAVPAAARYAVWETAIRKHIPEILGGFYPFKIINHTDLLLERNAHLMEQIAQQGEVLIIDEAHHFRNRTSARYRKLFDMLGTGPSKQVFMLTATPINNSFLDMQHLIELFTQRREDYFAAAPLGIHNLSGHFRTLERGLRNATGTEVSDSIDKADELLRGDRLADELIVQRSRAYVKRSLHGEDGPSVLFPMRRDPVVAQYSLKKSYGKLIDDFTRSFDRVDERMGQKRPILSLAIYSPYEPAYYTGDPDKVDEMKAGRQTQVVNLIRQLLLKRFESSAPAFMETCIRIYTRLQRFVSDYRSCGNPRAIERFMMLQEDVATYANQYAASHMPSTIEDMEDEVPEYVWNAEENLSEDDFDIRSMLDDTMLDMEVLAGFIRDMRAIEPGSDDKVRELKRILREDPRTRDKKVVIFTEYRATAQHICAELKEAGFEGVDEIDGTSVTDRHGLIERFAPYYNDRSSSEVEDEIQILVSTDVLAEGLNLQDASCVINYELHWNPVRLMQRIGRVDRRRSQELEARMIADHPELAADRENVYIWNFLPPEELEQMLFLYRTVSSKTLRISKVFGIEGRKLLTPEDDYDAVKEFNAQYEGVTSPEEEMALAYQELLADNPGYLDTLADLPRKMGSGKRTDGIPGFFFCYELPMKRADGTWTDGDGRRRWYLYDPATGAISERQHEIWERIRCGRDEPRYLPVDAEDFQAVRKAVEKHIKNGYLREVQAPLGQKPRLVTWMQLA